MHQFMVRHFSRFRLFFNDHLHRFRATEHAFMVIVAIIIGVLGGFGAVGIQFMIKFFQKLLWGAWQPDLAYLKTLPVWIKIGVPTFGGLLVGTIVHFFSKEAKGHGVPEVMEAIALRNGVIRPRVVFAKLFASAICIGSGGSVGREGPVIQIGSSIGSTVAQFLGVTAQRVKVFVACGAAAGIAAAFNAPIAGALFSVEIILGDFGVAQFSPIVISSVMATVVSRHFLGDFPAFEVPHYELVSPFELVPYAVLGLLAGLVALLFTKVLYFLEDYFDELRLHAIVKTVIGGLLIGLMGLLVPSIYGVGYNTMNMALHGQLSCLVMLALIFAKILATSISLGSGGSGGVFAPSLFIGTMTGGFFGSLIHYLLPAATATSGAYSLVGMGAVVAGATHAPITAILIIFELTNDYKIILPLMISSIIATLLTTKLKKESIYTLKLIRRGVDLFQGREVNLLRSLKVADYINEKPVIIPPNLKFSALLELVANYPNSQFYVVNEQQKLMGSVSLQEVRKALLDRDYIADLLIAVDLVNREIPRVTMEDSLDQVMKLFGSFEHDELPVVERLHPDVIVGSIKHKEVIEAYNRQLVKRNLSQEVSSSVKLLDQVQKVDFIDGYVMAEIPVPVSFVGRTIREINIRARFGVQILLVKRVVGELEVRQIVPAADERIREGDQLVVLGSDREIETLRHL
ncbi:MAG: chloride channel protein [Deltaproteobacteria bacterium]|nr:chloride channel protein [Candidatus Anaeroferrophillus wilburensis]MBN2889849.1 chloride channel protein [Deltaproteobacteria bacterium]